MKSQSSRRALTRSGIYGLVGRGISYTLSPIIFRRVFDDLGWQAVYGVFDLAPASLPRFVASATNAGVAGFNVTQPYKVSIMRHLDRVDSGAIGVGAVNTVVRRGRSWVGFNTDVHGVRQALSSYRRDLRQSQAIIIGSGGAAQAVAYTLAHELHVGEVTFTVRSVAKGRSIVKRLSARRQSNCMWRICPLTRDALQERLVDSSLLVNATPVGGHGLESQSPLPRGVKIPSSLVVFDLVYRPRQTRLLRDAKAAGCKRLVNGWGMLVAQAEESLFLWTGTRFPERVRKELLAMEKAD